MADISKIQLPSGSVYDIKDTVARQMLSSLSITMAWDGNSTPVASTIPAGVKVTYNGTTTTGTLAATSTAASPRSFYLVKSSTSPTEDSLDVYDEYVIVKPSSSTATWRWEKIGDTKINLSDVVKTVQLDKQTVDVLGIGATVSVTNPSIKLQSIASATTGDNASISVATGVNTASITAGNRVAAVTGVSLNTTEIWKEAKPKVNTSSVTNSAQYVQSIGSATSKYIKADLKLGEASTTDVVTEVGTTKNKMVTDTITGIASTSQVNVVKGRSAVTVMSSAVSTSNSNADFLKDVKVQNETLMIGAAKTSTTQVYEANSPGSITLPVAATAAKTFATGAVSSAGTGASLVTDVSVGSDNKVAVVTSYPNASVTISTASAGDVSVITGVGSPTTKYLSITSASKATVGTSVSSNTANVLGDAAGVSVTLKNINLQAVATGGSAGIESQDKKSVLSSTTKITVTKGNE